MRRRQLLAAVGGLLGGAAGCTTRDRVFDTHRRVKDAPADGPDAAPWPTLARDSRRTGHAPYAWLPGTVALGQLATAGRRSGVRPVLVDGTVYFNARRADEEGWRGTGPAGVRAVGGDLREWFVAEPNPVATPTVAGDALLLSTARATRALDRRDGTLCWEYRTGTDSPPASPTALDGAVYVVGDRVYRLSATTGAVEWASDRVPGRLRGTAATEDGVFATADSGDGGTVYRFDPATGRRLWATPTTDGLTIPPVVGDLVYVFEAGGRLRALEPSDGSESWSRELEGRGATLPATAGGTVFAVSAGGNTLAAFDALTGGQRWQFRFGGRVTADPTVADDTVYLPTAIGERGQLVGIKNASGRVKGSIQLPRPPVSPLIATPGTGLVATGSRWEIRLWSLAYPDS